MCWKGIDLSFERIVFGVREKSLLTVMLLFTVSTPLFSDGGVIFEDIARDEQSGLTYERVPSARNEIWDLLKERRTLTFLGAIDVPIKPWGAPGVAVLDFDMDGDWDLYVTNGPGVGNSLFSNQLQEQGELAFIDVGNLAGVGASDQDSGGVCYGDTDNDGDPDLLVLGSLGGNRFFENRGDGTFIDHSVESGLAVEERHPTSCSFGDVNNDGLLDVVIGNCCVDVENSLAIFDHFGFNEHNQLFLNQGSNQFADVSATSGILELDGFPAEFAGFPSLTWAISMVDFDLDGDIDIFQADDQASAPPAIFGGIDRGMIHLLENDGTGHFTDRVVESGLNRMGAWMGLSFGDLNDDGHLDLFATNVGDYANTIATPQDPVYGVVFPPLPQGLLSSRWFLGSEDGVFQDSGAGDLVGTPFGWGTSMLDYDSDGDTDIFYHGGLDPGLLLQLAPGAVLANDGAGNFSRDVDALITDHERRQVHGVAVGDLNDDGYADVVSVASHDVPAEMPLSTYNHLWGSPFDGGHYNPTFVPEGNPPVFVYRGDRYNKGSLSVEINSADNGHGWAKVRLMGTTGITSGGMVNRDGIGAVVSFRTSGGQSTMRPVTGGASHASQDSLELTFGLGDDRGGVLEVLWPGGVRNRLYGVGRGERLLIPEIPCRFDIEWPQGFKQYATCVMNNLQELEGAEVVDRWQSRRLFRSALRAYEEETVNLD